MTEAEWRESQLRGLRSKVRDCTGLAKRARARGSDLLAESWEEAARFWSKKLKELEEEFEPSRQS